MSYESHTLKNPWGKNQIYNKRFCDNCLSKRETQLPLYIMACAHIEFQLNFHLIE